MIVLLFPRFIRFRRIFFELLTRQARCVVRIPRHVEEQKSDNIYATHFFPCYCESVMKLMIYICDRAYAESCSGMSMSKACPHIRQNESIIKLVDGFCVEIGRLNLLLNFSVIATRSYNTMSTSSSRLVQTGRVRLANRDDFVATVDAI